MKIKHLNGAYFRAISSKEIIKMRKEKAFFINGRENEVLLNDWETSDGCIATDRITVDGLPVGYMYREKPEEGDPFERYDSGWRFTAGDESDEICKPLKIVVSIS